MNKQTDNSNLKVKLDLRRYFLRKFHADGNLNVLDCCQGGGVIWNCLRSEFKIDSYLGVDLKCKKGRLKIDSSRILSLPCWPQNVIDIDTYGTPFKHWVAMLPNVRNSVTVFLTLGSSQGQNMASGQQITALSRAILGIGTLQIPSIFGVKINRLGNDYMLAESYKFGINIIEAAEAVSDANARYIGVRLEKQPGIAVPDCEPQPTYEEISYG